VGKVAIYASGTGEYGPQGSEKFFTFGGDPIKVPEGISNAEVIAHIRRRYGVMISDGEHGPMTEAGKGLEVAARAAAEVENREGWLATDVAQERGDVLTHVVVAGAFAKVFGTLLVMGECPGSDLFECGGK